eukprot:TRINITY_DN3772_c0_g1_i1.p3 TRINITY_DN3772_c0_g1~~TRINITY_DN3772_c0_g1_i1.p3  ORF type:complete len:192 (+),score=-11.08 TRINITY_DN3772_c0_g1_i1:1363-1938(+)
MQKYRKTTQKRQVVDKFKENILVPNLFNFQVICFKIFCLKILIIYKQKKFCVAKLSGIHCQNPSNVSISLIITGTQKQTFGMYFAFQECKIFCKNLQQMEHLKQVHRQDKRNNLFLNVFLMDFKKAKILRKKYRQFRARPVYMQKQSIFQIALSQQSYIDRTYCTIYQFILLTKKMQLFLRKQKHIAKSAW